MQGAATRAPLLELDAGLRLEVKLVVFQYAVDQLVRALVLIL
jgi:hypothetical protein